MSAAVADRLFAAIERGDYPDIEALWADDVLVWHSGDTADNDRARALKVIRWFLRATAARRYEILDRQFFEGGGDAQVDGDKLTGTLRIDAASVRTGIKRRDAHLRSADFFDVEAFPTVEVVAESGEVTSPSWVTLHVRLTVKGHESELDLPVHVRNLGGGAVQLSTTATLNRRNLGVDGNLLGMMGDAAGVEAAAVFVRQP